MLAGHSRPCFGKGFVWVADEDQCLPEEEYLGACDKGVSFRNMSIGAKKRFSQICGAAWPCVECERDFGEPCPQDWELAQSEAWKCKPKAEYGGPCSGIVSFDGFTRAMLLDWQGRCSAYWACAGVSDADLQMEALQIERPLSLSATMWRISRA